MKEIRSTLTWQMGMLLIKSALLGAVLGLALFLGGSTLLTDYFENAGWQETQNRRRIVSFQQYVTRNGLKATDSAAFTRWTDKQYSALLEIRRGTKLLYSSTAPEVFSNTEEEWDIESNRWVTYYDVVFSDGTAEVAIYANDMAQANLYLATASALSGFLVFLGLFLWQCSKIVSYICLLSRQIQDMEGGDLGVSISRRGNNELTRLADSLDSMRIAFAQQREQETALFQTHQKMVTQMSHDLRTPLTSLQIYMDILLYKECGSEQHAAYLKRMDEKLRQLRQLADNMFTYALSSGQATEEPLMSCKELFHDILLGQMECLSRKGFRFALQLEWPEVRCRAEAGSIQRLMDNIFSNINKYADKEQPVGIAIRRKGSGAELCFENRILENPSPEESTRIGLSVIQTVTEQMGGNMRITQDHGVFCLKLWLPDGS